MSNYTKVEYCMTCKRATTHEWRDDTPRHHEYTAVCEVCGTQTEGKDFHSIDTENLIDLREYKFDRLNRPSFQKIKRKPKRFK